MQASLNINDIIQKISSLSIEDQTFIAEAINKRIHELRNMEIIERAKKAKRNYELGNVTRGSVEDLMKIINDD